MTATTERSIRNIATNRKMLHDYEILARYEAGIALVGTEVKSLRAGKVNMMDSYAAFPNKNSDEFYLFNLHISPYEFGNRENHEVNRRRKLLLHDYELRKLRTGIEEKGLTVVLLSIYFSGAYVKVELGLARGKNTYDKRAALKEKDEKKNLRNVRY